jgi:putative transposase
MPEFLRKDIRLNAEYYLGRRLYFVTLCFHDRRRFGQNPRIAQWLIEELRKHAANCFFLIHAYCVMPDHVHILVGGASETSSMLTFVVSFKQHTSAEFAQRAHRVLWQFKYYDHILRGRDSADRVAWYIWSNPVRKGLCAKPTEYPFLGSFTEMGTRMLKDAMIDAWVPPWKEEQEKATSNARSKGNGKMPG